MRVNGDCDIGDRLLSSPCHTVAVVVMGFSILFSESLG